MKRKLACIAGVLLIAIFLSCCTSYRSKKQKYYSQKESYICATGILEFLQYNDDGTALYLVLSEVTPYFDDNTFKLVGDNLQIAKNNGIDSKLHPGDKITFISAPRYFGDGYVFPVIALSVNETNLLNHEEGLLNFLDWLHNHDA